MTEFTGRIVETIKGIPVGRVATYGQIAAMSGNSRGARQVSWTLRTQTAKHDLPWQRVISSQGKISLQGDGGLIQADLLRSEGVEVDGTGKINLKKYGWNS